MRVAYRANQLLGNPWHHKQLISTSWAFFCRVASRDRNVSTRLAVYVLFQVRLAPWQAVADCELRLVPMTVPRDAASKQPPLLGFIDFAFSTFWPWHAVSSLLATSSIPGLAPGAPTPQYMWGKT